MAGISDPASELHQSVVSGAACVGAALLVVLFAGVVRSLARRKQEPINEGSSLLQGGLSQSALPISWKAALLGAAVIGLLVGGGTFALMHFVFNTATSAPSVLPGICGSNASIFNTTDACAAAGCAWCAASDFDPSPGWCFNPDNATCCEYTNGNSLCNAGPDATCCGGPYAWQGYCAAAGYSCCGSTACSPSEGCCRQSQCYSLNESICCDDGSSCPIGERCMGCASLSCCDANTTSCCSATAASKCCAAGTTCQTKKQQDATQNVACCPPGISAACAWDNRDCCPAGQTPCCQYTALGGGQQCCPTTSLCCFGLAIPQPFCCAQDSCDKCR